MSRSFNPPRFSPSRWAFAAVAAGLGAAACVYTLVTGIQARSWTATQATMTQCEVVEGRKGSKRLEVSYDYTFDGRSYTGTRFGFSDGASKDEWAARFAAGSTVTCFVNPTNPGQAMLQREMGMVYWFLPGCFLAAAAGLGYGAKRALAQQRIAAAATLYSLETPEVAPSELRKAA